MKQRPALANTVRSFPMEFALNSRNLFPQEREPQGYGKSKATAENRGCFVFHDFGGNLE
jgi:hypothetical protein